MDNFCIPAHAEFINDADLWRACGYLRSPSPTSPGCDQIASSLRSPAQLDDDERRSSSNACVDLYHSQSHHHQQQQRPASPIDDISTEPCIFSFSTRAQSGAYNEFGVRDGVADSPIADALLALKHAVVHTPHSSSTWMPPSGGQLSYHSHCAPPATTTSYQSASPPYDRSGDAASPFPFASSHHHHQQHQHQHRYQSADSQDSSSSALTSSTPLYHTGDISHRPTYKRDFSFGSAFVHDASAESFPSMSVNLSMCMNVDVTTHEQLLNGGQVTARHPHHSATDQFRDDDPWTRYRISGRSSPPASLMRYRRAVSPVSNCTAALQQYGGRSSATYSTVAQSYGTSSNDARSFVPTNDSAASVRMLPTTDTHRHHHHHHQYQQVGQTYRPMTIPRYGVEVGGLACLRRRTGVVPLGFRTRPDPVLSSRAAGPGPVTAGSGVEKTNVCRVCGKSYARPSTLKTHMRTHSGEKPYICTTCRKSFSQAANLTAHVRTHSGEKPFRCPVCNRSFSQSSSVTTHLRTHSGERPYRCRLCKKTFSDSSTLTKHLRIHSGEKPYQCKICLLRFSQSGNLNRHMRVHGAM